MKAIGGYPELELRKGEHYHKNALRLNTARNCLKFILLARNYQKVYVPYYTCDAVYEPFDTILKDITIELYNIDKDLDPAVIPPLGEDEAFLYTNYFGLKQDTVERLAKKYKTRLIVDNSQAFFDDPVPGIDTFYSARKFFGVPDGAYLYTDVPKDTLWYQSFDTDISYDRMSALIKRIDLSPESGYKDFQQIEDSLSCQPIKKMSKLTDAIMASIDYDEVREIRRRNYDVLYWRLFQKQKFWVKRNHEAVPLCYPFLSVSPEVRKRLIQHKIFVPTYWPNVLSQCKEDSVEYKYAANLLPLPISQNYNAEDMLYLSDMIMKLM